METDKSKNSGKSKESSTSQNYNYESEEHEIQDYENDDFNFLKDFEENVNKQFSILDRNTKNFIKILNRANEKLIIRRKS